AISAGGAHTCAIRTDGTHICWGDNTCGQLNNMPTGVLTAVSAGEQHACGINIDGTVVCWGDNSVGEAPQPRVQPATLASGTVNAAYNQVFGLTSDNDSTLYQSPAPIFTVVAGVLPAQFSLSPNGVLAGSATAVGTFNFTIRGLDGNGFAATNPYALAIVDNTPPVICSSVSGILGNNGWYL